MKQKLYYLILYLYLRGFSVGASFPCDIHVLRNLHSESSQQLRASSSVQSRILLAAQICIAIS